MAEMGRPPFQPTDAQRKRVAVLAGKGWPHEEIALAISISPITLKKYFEHELSVGAYERRAEVVEALHAAASKANVTAAREYLKDTPAIAAPPLPVEKPEELGKKAQANETAKTAQVGSEWAELLPGPKGMQ